MQEFVSVNEILEFAISEEDAAEQFYLYLAAQMTGETMAKVFQNFAAEEREHKKKLLTVQAQGIPLRTELKGPDLNTKDFLLDLEDRFQVFDHQGRPLNYQQALIFAMKKEKAAFKLYTYLAENTAQPDFKTLIGALAQEEARHKLRLELEYNAKFLEDV